MIALKSSHLAPDVAITASVVLLYCMHLSRLSQSLCSGSQSQKVRVRWQLVVR